MNVIVTRQIKRNQLKSEYKEFCVMWRVEKARRIQAKKDGGEKSDVQLLGRKPTLPQWKDLKNKHSIAEAERKLAMRKAEDEKIEKEGWSE